jgi:hypothetical protein
MHCPRCGQQQVSPETKFCSRCGLPLDLVTELVAHNGFLPQLAELENDKTVFTRRNGVVLSVFWFMFFTLLLSSLFGIADIDALAGICAVIGVFGGAMLLIAALVFLKKTPKNGQYAPVSLPAPNINALHGAQQTALPPQHSVPVSNYAPPGAGAWKAPDTGEMRPPSVTEGTTKLLQNDE